MKECFVQCHDNNCRYNCPDNAGLNWSEWESNLIKDNDCINCYERKED